MGFLENSLCAFCNSNNLKRFATEFLTASDNVCCYIRNVKFSKYSIWFIMRGLFTMFISAVGVLFLLKMKWPKNKDIYDIYYHFVISECNNRGTSIRTCNRKVVGSILAKENLDSYSCKKALYIYI